MQHTWFHDKSEVSQGLERFVDLRYPRDFQEGSTDWELAFEIAGVRLNGVAEEHLLRVSQEGELLQLFVMRKSLI